MQTDFHHNVNIHAFLIHTLDTSSVLVGCFHFRLIKYHLAKRISLPRFTSKFGFEQSNLNSGNKIRNSKK